MKSNFIKVVRWSSEIIKADDLICQQMSWGGFNALALCFTPYENEKDDRFFMWKDMVEKHHKTKVFPNKYLLDISNLPYKNSDELIKIAKLAYENRKVDKFLKNKLGIYLTLSQTELEESEIVEFRIYNHCNYIKIYDYESIWNKKS